MRGAAARPVDRSGIRVEGYVKKLAFCRKTQPVLFGLALLVFLKIKRTLMPSGKRQPASLMGA